MTSHDIRFGTRAAVDDLRVQRAHPGVEGKRSSRRPIIDVRLPVGPINESLLLRLIDDWIAPVLADAYLGLTIEASPMGASEIGVKQGGSTVFDSNLSQQSKVAVYTRYSSSLQRSSSTHDQLRQCREVASRKGWVVLNNYVRSDEAVSGRGRVGRDGFDELIALAQQRDCPFDGIVIDDTSRFGRNLSQTLPLSDLLEEAGVFLHFANRGLDSRDPNFRQLFIGYGQHDEAFSRSLGEKVHRGQRGRVLNGYIGNGRVYGYTNVPIEDPIRKGLYGRPYVEAVKLVINPDQAATVVRIFEMYRGGLGHRAIAVQLNQEGVHAPLRGISDCRRFWNTPSVAKILKNEKYRGVHVWNRTRTGHSASTQMRVQRQRPASEWERVEVPEWRIVSDQLWESVRRENNGRQGAASRQKGGHNRTSLSRTYIFSGLLNCQVCGGKMNIVSGTGQNVRYGCTRHRFEGTCSNALTIKRTALEISLLEAISSNLLVPGIHSYLAKAVKEQVNKKLAQRQLQESRGTTGKPALRRKLDNFKQQAENLVNAVAQGFNSSLVQTRLESLERQIQDLSVTLAAPDVRLEPNAETHSFDSFLNGLRTGLAQTLMSFPEEAKQQLSKRIGGIVLRPTHNDTHRYFELGGDIDLFQRLPAVERPGLPTID